MNLLLVAVFLPFVAGLLVALFSKRYYHSCNVLMLGVSVFAFLAILSQAPAILSGEIAPVQLADLDFFKLIFAVDALSLLMASVISFLWIFTFTYSFGYMFGEHSLPRFFTSLTMCLGATLGIIFSGNLITFFIFYELLTIIVYPLVIHEETIEAFRAGIIYMSYLLSGGAVLFFAIVLTYFLSDGNLAFTLGGIPQLAGQSRGILYLLFFLFVGGLGVKSAIVPLHSWLPRAMVAPTPVSALLHAVAVVNVGLYGFIRMIYHVFGPQLFAELHLDLILACIVTITIILGALRALRVEKIKKLLAYSTINQLSYVILGASSLNPTALLGALIHVVYHSIMKITLFYSAGTIIRQTGKTRIQELSGLAKTMPITCAAFTIGALGISGLPPIAGWVSKWYLIDGFLEIGRPWFAAVFILSTIIEIGFLSPPIIYAYFGGSDNRQDNPRIKPNRIEAPKAMLFPLLVVAILSITFGLIGSLPFVFARASLEALIP